MGKSSLLNELVEKKVWLGLGLGNSSCPGHHCPFLLTLPAGPPCCPGGKHLPDTWAHQTLPDHLPHQVRPTVRLPWAGVPIAGQQTATGLSLGGFITFTFRIDTQCLNSVPPQILSGMYPIAQVREPYTVVGYLAERVPLIQLLRLQHPDPDTGSRVEAESLLQPKTDRAHGVAREQVRDTAVSGSNVPLDQLSAWRLESGVEKMEAEESGRGCGTGQVWTPWDLCDGRFPCKSL